MFTLYSTGTSEISDVRKECGEAGSDWLSAGPVIWFNDAPTAYFAAMMDPKLTAAPTHVWCVQTGPSIK